MPGVVEEAASTLTGIDVAIVVIYMIGILVLGTFFARYVKSAGDFFVAGRALPFWAIGTSVVVSDIGATDFIATAGAGYTYGIAAANFDWMGSMPAMVFAAFIFVPYYWRSGVFTIPEFLGRRYNATVQLAHALIWGIVLVTMLSVMLWLTAQMLNTILGWDVYFCIWLIVAITGLYTLSGGLSAVVMTDVVQLVVMFVGGAALLFLSLHATGGFGALQDKVANKNPEAIVFYTFGSEEAAAAFEGEAAVRGQLAAANLDLAEVTPAAGKIEKDRRAFRVSLNSLLPATESIDAGGHTKAVIMDTLAAGAPEGAEVDGEIRIFGNFFKLLLPHDSSTPYPWTGIVFGLGIVMATGYMAGNQAVVQRTLGARSEWDAKGGMLFAGFLKVFIPLLVIVPGLAAVVVEPGLAKGDMAVPSMIRDLLPPGLRGLMFAALFAALMSSVDSSLNSAATIWTTDLYGRFHTWIAGAEPSAKLSLTLGRSCTILFILMAGYFAPFLAGQETMYNFIQTTLSMFQGPVFAILLLGIMWRRTTQWGGLAGLVLGVAFTTILHNTEDVFPSDDPFLFVAWWSFVFSLAVTVIVSLVTPQDPDEKVRGLVFGQVMKDGEIQRVLRERVE